MQVPSPYTFEPSSAASVLATLPEGGGIYALTTPGHPPHLSWSINLKRRLTRLLVPSYTAAQKHFSKYTEKLSEVSYWPVGSKLESALILYLLTSRYYPDDYLRRLRLRMPWFLSLLEGSGFARLEVTNRLSQKALPRFGPFSSRDVAAQHREQVLALHQLRRCSETLHPSSEHPGCIYGEMSQCLRPCQLTVTAEEYASEAARVLEFLSTSGKSALSPLTAARDRAAEDLHFEQAAMLQKRIEKVNAATAGRDKVVGPVASFHGVALTKSRAPDTVCLWPMVGGYWQNPVSVLLDIQQSNARSLDTSLRELLTSAVANATADGKRVEHLALFSRWYYSSWCDGEWFPFQTVEDVNYRRLVREMSKLVRTT